MKNLTKNYLSIKEEALKPSSFRVLERHFKKMSKLLPKNAKHTTLSDAIKANNVLAKTLAPRTHRNILINIRAVFQLAKEDGLIEKNPFAKIQNPTTQIPNISPFSKQEVQKMLEKADGYLKNFLGIAFYTGMRGGEILALTWDDIDFAKMTISISKSVTEGICYNETKTKENRTIPLFKEVLPFLEDLHDNKKCKWLFAGRGNDHYWGVASFYRKWKQLQEDCKIPYRSLRHTRHTFATKMVEKALKENSKIKLLWVSKILGHSSLQMTLQVYVRHTEGEHLKIDRGLEIY